MSACGAYTGIVPLNRVVNKNLIFFSAHNFRFRGRLVLQTAKGTMDSIPFPSVWGIHAAIAGRPIIWGLFNINSITDNRVIGTVNFRGTPIPINGYWDWNTKQLIFDSPYAAFSGNLTIFDDPSIRIRHYILNGRLIMKPPSLQAGEYGTWVATTDRTLTGYPVSSSTLPPVGVFLTSNILSQIQQNYGRYLV